MLLNYRVMHAFRNLLQTRMFKVLSLADLH